MLHRNWSLKAIAFLLALALWGWVLVNQRTAASARTVPVVVRTSGALPAGLRIVAVETEPAVVTIAGPEQTVSAIQGVDTADLPLGRLTIDTVERLRLVLPKDTRLLRETEVKVTVRVRPVAAGGLGPGGR